MKRALGDTPRADADGVGDEVRPQRKWQPVWYPVDQRPWDRWYGGSTFAYQHHAGCQDASNRFPSQGLLGGAGDARAAPLPLGLSENFRIAHLYPCLDVHSLVSLLSVCVELNEDAR